MGISANILLHNLIRSYRVSQKWNI